MTARNIFYLVVDFQVCTKVEVDRDFGLSKVRAHPASRYPSRSEREI